MVQYEHLHANLYNPLFVSIGLAVGQCEYTVIRKRRMKPN